MSDNDQTDSQDRRSMLATGLMACGLAGGYGAFFTMAGRFLFPIGDNQAWMFVAAVDRVAPGASIPFKSPVGVSVSITRKTESANETSDGEEVTADSFLALSSVCPHLGCRVHWEGHNDRFFCPCHNGVFDPNGKATSGPPASAKQNLPRYPLKVVDGVLYIEMPFRSV